ncbi:MAG: UDP-N-acetylmuramate:L-alanyl-gamma-D-glutamyl-meso-diaminopimelate ligase [Verrucomicrobia bacterium]|nr:UDP-N-acetylmuramate:L-alanyl-gamma-D-glutamyl-meso-diaminopimelate ligase [Verrucomicrobiota bacterium]
MIEGDEYDSAFFDKRSKFIHYSPNVVLLNNLEFDHADIFRDLADVQRTFNHLLRIVPGNGCIIANGDDANLAGLLNLSWTPVIKVGVGANNDLRIVDFSESPEGAQFKLVWRSMPWAEVRWQIPGLYNARNAAMAAMACARITGKDPLDTNLSALAHFRGVKRRQEVLLDNGRSLIVSDFGHHPTAIRETLLSLRARFPGRILTACFEARSNTACRNILQNEFANALAVADRVHLGAVFRAERYRDEERLNTTEVAATIGTKAVAHRDNEQLLQHVCAGLKAQPLQLVCMFSNGSFDGVMPRLVQYARDLTAPSE